VTRWRVAAPLLGILAFASACAWLGPKPAWQVPPPPIEDRPLLEPGHLHRAHLQNGIDLLVLEDHRLPRVTLGVTVRRGEAGVPVEQAGLAGYTAELMQRGAGARDALALARAIEDLGARLSVSTDWDSMTVEVSGLATDLDRLLGLLEDVTLRPRFDPGEAAKARAERLAGLEAQKDDPRTLASWHLAGLLYPGHRFGLPLAGSADTVRGLDAAAARAFYQRVFVARDAIVYASGDLSAADFEGRVRQGFGSWAAGEVPDPGPPAPSPAPPARRVVIVDRPDLVQAQIAFGHEGISRTDPQRYAVLLMNSVVGGGGFSSRLMERVRAEAGLTYSVGSGFVLRRTPGPFVVQTFTRIPETRRVIDLVLQVLDRARTDPPTAKELRDAQSEAVGSFALGLETSDAIADALVGLDVYGLPEDSLDTYRSRVRAVTTAETAAAARDHLHPERMGIVVVGPAQALRPQLEGLGPIEVVKP
jgi:zinc protease